MGLAMKKPVSKLIDLEIDEVSVVDRGANQHSLISFSKSLAAGQEPDVEERMSMTFVTDDGTEVTEDQLLPGDVIVDEDGNEYELYDESELGDLSAEDDGFDSDDDDDDVDKALYNPLNAPGAFMRGFGRATKQGASRKDAMRRGLRGAMKDGGAVGAAGLAAAGAGAGLYAANRKKGEMSKSLGEEILEEFSKAVTDRDREAVISKMADEVDRAHEIAKQALAYAEAEKEARLDEAFISKAAEYNLPVEPEVFGPILKAMATALTSEQLEVVDALFNSIGDYLFDEVGYVGESSNTSVLDRVDAFASDFVGKSDVSKAQAMTFAFENNPAAYDAYLAEMGR